MCLRFHRYAVIALLIVGSATLLFSCGTTTERVEYDLETLMTERSENRTITMTENGKRSYSFTAPLIEGYSLAQNPYQEFRKGVKMITYTSDSLSLQDATITANYAIYYDKQKLWEAKGNVVIIKKNRKAGDTIVTGLTEVYTQQLFWDARTKKVYSNVDTKVLQPDGWHFGVGFEADEDLKNIHFRKYKSEMEFDFSPVEESPEDKKGDKTTDAKQGGDKRGDRPKPGGRPAPRESKRPGVNPSMSTNPTVGKTPSVAKSPQVPQSPARQRPNVGAQSLSTQMSVSGAPSKNTGAVDRSGSPAKRAGEQRIESSPKSAGARSATAKPVAGAKSSSTQTKR
jgi:LPS export ABC transporter protein LptC